MKIFDILENMLVLKLLIVKLLVFPLILLSFNPLIVAFIDTFP